MKKFLDGLVEACFQMFRLRPQFPAVGLQPFTSDECRTIDGQVCTLQNFDRIPQQY
ncbi:hypothetical protein [Anthocerotibacter panamensis]|uniref:hypothetical protein n=1 Tax=Anthocerotibacter panamensis TaxID=2857077 RepID=UPI001C4039BC|nr:hypothetical protein [Anthocerotibacter panamensis]